MTSPTVRAPIFQLDSFTTTRFAGNPAAVVVLEEFLHDASMQAIAAENNLAETAFLVAAGTEHHLRWFTPTVEVKLCGHATLATAAVVMERLEPGREKVVFESMSGPLTVHRSGSRYVMDFPARPSEPVSVPTGLAEALGGTPVEVHLNSFNYLAVFENADVVRTLRPDMNAIAQIDEGVIVTAPGDAPYDFTSRYFAPAKGIPEDPVTGGAHCMLTPYWAHRLGKSDFLGFQASSRGGEVTCGLRGDRVRLEGSCVFYLEGEIQI